MTDNKIPNKTFKTTPIAKIARDTNITRHKLTKERDRRGITGPDGRGGNRPALSPGEPSVSLTINLPISLRDKAKKTAKKDGSSIAQVVREGIVLRVIDHR